MAKDSLYQSFDATVSYIRRLQIFLIQSEIHPVSTNTLSCLLNKEISDARVRPVALPRVAPGRPRQPYLAKLCGRLEPLAPRSHLPTSRQTSAARLALLHSVSLKPPNALWLLARGPSYAGKTSSDLHAPHHRYKNFFIVNNPQGFSIEPAPPLPTPSSGPPSLSAAAAPARSRQLHDNDLRLELLSRSTANPA